MSVYKYIFAVIFWCHIATRVRTEIAHHIICMFAAVIKFWFVKTSVYFFSEEATCFYAHADVDLPRIDI